MRNKVCCSAREQGMPYSKVGAVQYSLTERKMAFKSVLVIWILLFLVLSLICEGLIIQSAGATDGAESLLDQDAKVSPVRLRNRGHSILLSSRRRFTRARQADNDYEEETTKANLRKASKRQHLRKMLARRLQELSDGNCNAVAVATRFRSAQLRRQMEPANDPARQRVPLTSRPIKALFILCAKKKVGVRVAMTSPSRAPPANQHVIPFENNHRRALKQFPPLQIPPLPFIRPPAPPRFQFPPLPITLPPVPPLPFTLPAPPLPKSMYLTIPPLPPFPFINIPSLPFHLPPFPCVPSSTGKSLPPP